MYASMIPERTVPTSKMLPVYYNSPLIHCGLKKLCHSYSLRWKEFKIPQQAKIHQISIFSKFKIVCIVLGWRGGAKKITVFFNNLDGSSKNILTNEDDLKNEEDNFKI